MKINNVRSAHGTKRIGSVKFGSLVRVHDVPDYWSKVFKSSLGRFGKYFLLTSEHYIFAGKGQLLIIDVSTGDGIGLKTDHLVEVIHNAEVVLNENHYS